ADRLRTVSYGKEFPFDPGHDEAAFAKNRRAHFVTTSKSAYETQSFHRPARRRSPDRGGAGVGRQQRAPAADGRSAHAAGAGAAAAEPDRIGHRGDQGGQHAARSAGGRAAERL